MNWWSSVASANWSIIVCVTTRHGETPTSVPTADCELIERDRFQRCVSFGERDHSLNSVMPCCTDWPPSIGRIAPVT